MKKENGFINIFIIIVIAVIAVASIGGGVYVATQDKPEDLAPIDNSPPTEIIPQENDIPDTDTPPETKKNIKPSIIKIALQSAPTVDKPPVSPPPPTEPAYTNKLNELEREITVLFEQGGFIGDSHYNTLVNQLNAIETQVTATVDLELISFLREQLEIVSPGALGSLSPPPTIPTKTCINNSNPVFTEYITDMNRISQITPPGTIFSGNVVKSHSYLWISDGNTVPVYAPVDMTLSAGAHYLEQGMSQYLLFFEVSCEVEIKFDHILNPVQIITDALPQTPQTGSQTSPPTQTVKFSAGDLIANTSGTSGAHNWDFGVYNTTISPNPVTTGYSNLEEIDKRADCGYDYFESSKQSTYRTLFNVQIGGSSQAIPYCVIQQNTSSSY